MRIEGVRQVGLTRHCRGLKRLWSRESKDNPLPLDFGLLEIDQKTDGEAGSSEVIEALRGVLAGEPLRTFQLDHQLVFDEDVGKVFSDRVDLVAY